jgi:hypothetical protein
VFRNVSRSAVPLIFVITLTPAASAVVATGKAPLTGDLAANRGAALGDARVRAVEQTLGVYVNSQVRVEYEVVVQASILTRAAGYVVNEAVVDEYQDRYFYYVTIECDVKEEDLAAELDKAKISVAVDVEEQVLGRAVPPSGRVLEGKIRAALVQARHLCADASFGEAAGFPAAEAPVSRDEAAALGRTYMARVVVCGSVAAEVIGRVPEYLPGGEKNPVGGAFIVDPTVNVKAVDTDTGKIIAEFQSSPQQFRGLGFQAEMAASFALNYAANDVPKFFVEKLAYLNKYPEREVTVVFENVADVDVAAQLKRALESQWFVVRCLTSDYASGRASFKLLYAGDVMVLAVGLGHLKNPSVNVRSVADDRLEWEVVP